MIALAIHPDQVDFGFCSVHLALPFLDRVGVSGYRTSSIHSFFGLVVVVGEEEGGKDSGWIEFIRKKRRILRSAIIDRFRTNNSIEEFFELEFNSVCLLILKFSLCFSWHLSLNFSRGKLVQRLMDLYFSNWRFQLYFTMNFAQHIFSTILCQFSTKPKKVKEMRAISP